MGGVRKLLQVRDAGACMELGVVVGFWMHLGSRACRICCGLDVGEETGIVTTRMHGGVLPRGGEGKGGPRSVC